MPTLRGHANFHPTHEACATDALFDLRFLREAQPSRKRPMPKPKQGNCFRDGGANRASGTPPPLGC
jgi:hypothetical protein